MLAGGTSLVALTALSIAAFGLQTWTVFQQSLGFTRRIVLEEGNIGWEKIQSVFSAVRMLGGPVAEAYALQGIVSGLILGGIAWLWHSRARSPCPRCRLEQFAQRFTPYPIGYTI